MRWTQIAFLVGFIVLFICCDWVIADVIRLNAMATTYFIANLSKRQFFEPDVVGGSENTKWHAILRGGSAHALAHLLSLDVDLQFGLQAWIGDAFFLVGDEDHSKVPKGLLELSATKNEAPFWIVKNQFSDISLNLVAQMCLRRGMLDHFIELATKYDSNFVDLAQIVQAGEAHELIKRFLKQFGPDWRKRYNKVIAENPWRARSQWTDLASAG